jgi:hypothetical protein
MFRFCLIQIARNLVLFLDRVRNWFVWESVVVSKLVSNKLTISGTLSAILNIFPPYSIAPCRYEFDRSWGKCYFDLLRRMVCVFLA